MTTVRKAGKAASHSWKVWGLRALGVPLMLWGTVALGSRMQAWSNDIAGLTHPDYTHTAVTVGRTFITNGGLLSGSSLYVTVRDKTGQVQTIEVSSTVYGQFEQGAQACIRTNHSARFPVLQDELLPVPCPAARGDKA